MLGLKHHDLIFVYLQWNCSLLPTHTSCCNLVAEEIGDLDRDGILHKLLMASDEVFLNMVDDLPLTR